MPKRIYQVGEPCDTCNTPTIAGNDGNGYCKACYIKWANENKPQKQSTQGNRDFDAENRGKVRHGLICAFIEGKSVDEIKAQMPDFKLLLMPLEQLIMGKPKADIAPRPTETPPVIQVEDDIDVESIPF